MLVSRYNYDFKYCLYFLYLFRANKTWDKNLGLLKVIMM